ncbi:MAG: endonuclease III [Deltaproteobacteria bacterium]|nr:endonuclease III [Deltaproteobacteria bacterium]
MAASPSPRNSTPPPPSATDRALAYVRGLAASWPDAVVELDHRNAYELLCATILAAQSTDRMINTLTPALFARWPDATALASADPAELEVVIHKSGFFRAKARSLLGMARAVVERHGGEVPQDLEALVALPGVGRKTANVVRGAVWGLADGIVVDTHVTRLAARLGLTRETDAVKIERDLMAVVPRSEWITFANRLIWHGRRVCHARAPQCGECQLAPVCPSADLLPEGQEKTKTKAKTAVKTVATKPGKTGTAARSGTGTGTGTGKKASGAKTAPAKTAPAKKAPAKKAPAKKR